MKQQEKMDCQETASASQLPKHEVAMAMHHIGIMREKLHKHPHGDGNTVISDELWHLEQAMTWLADAQAIMTPEEDLLPFERGTGGFDDGFGVPYK